LFIGFLLGFGSLIAACWILFGVYVVPLKIPRKLNKSLKSLRKKQLSVR